MDAELVNLYPLKSGEQAEHDDYNHPDQTQHDGDAV